MTTPDPFEEFQSLKPNSRAHAIYWLRHGELHPEIHFLIRERLERFIRRVEGAGSEVRAKLLAEIPPEERA